MPTLNITDGAAVAQMQAGGATPGEDCQESVLRAIGLRFGHDWSVRYIEGFMPHPQGGTDVPSGVDFLVSHGIPAHRVRTDIATRVNGAISRRHVCTSLVKSDIHGNPSPSGSVGHFLENVSTATWRVMNPAYGQFITYPNLTACDAYDGLEVDIVAPCDLPPSPPTPPTPLQQDEDVIQITRPGLPLTIDSFDVDPSGTGWHTVIVPGGNPSLPFNEKVPGSWDRFIHAEWSADGQSLTVVGRGWMNGAGGATYYTSWKNGIWASPTRQP